MRFPLLALLVSSLPSLAMAAAPVTTEQCAATTVKLLQEARYKEVAELFASANEAPQQKFDETVAKLNGSFAVLGTLSNIKHIPRKPDGHSIKLEVSDAKPASLSGTFSKTSYSMHSAVGGDVYLEVSYHMNRRNCGLIAVGVHLPRADSGNTSMSMTYETSNAEYFKQFEALLKERNVTRYKVDKTATKDKQGFNWKLTTLPFAPPGGSDAIKPFLVPFQEHSKKKPAEFSFTATATFSSASGSTKP